jgi:redox-sensitive bicupin YhaK (pirin superfamily)
MKTPTAIRACKSLLRQSLCLDVTDDRLEKGDVQWMTAGRGIMHSEMPYFDPDPTKEENSEGLQLWVDLPAKDKFCEPSYQERKAAE